MSADLKELSRKKKARMADLKFGHYVGPAWEGGGYKGKRKGEVPT